MKHREIAATDSTRTCPALVFDWSRARAVCRNFSNRCRRAVCINLSLRFAFPCKLLHVNLRYVKTQREIGAAVTLPQTAPLYHAFKLRMAE